jgi:hypothetical protein
MRNGRKNWELVAEASGVEADACRSTGAKTGEAITVCKNNSLQHGLLLGEKQDKSPFLARFARTMLAMRGEVSAMTEAVLVRLREQRSKGEAEVREAERKVRAIKRRYEAALKRQHRASGLPGDADLNRPALRGPPRAWPSQRAGAPPRPPGGPRRHRSPLTCGLIRLRPMGIGIWDLGGGLGATGRFARPWLAA